ncbi:zinc finger protein OZF-like [Macrobrachium rosenbergii]|uniref:zinc finger protein OZF-like n=1 Tax=Macrobrachium rosenbergii TaxID=79674 RepID=UPI0034D79BA6
MSILEYQLKSETEDPVSLSLIKNENVGLVGSDFPASYTSVSLDPMMEIKAEMKTEVEVCYESDDDMDYHCEDFTSAFGDEGDSLPIRKEVDKGKPFVCRECGKAFSWRSHLEQHFRIHTGERLYTCNDCGKLFPYKSSLKFHMAIHRWEKAFTCKNCGKSFSQKSNLKTHMVIHTGERAFACKDCGKSFSQKSHLKRHMRIHSGERAFSCKDCGKSFARKSSLESHKRIHLGEKSFACDECGKTFSSLKQHFLTHMGEKPFRCADCGKVFFQKPPLKVHLGETPIVCKNCNTSLSLDPLMEIKTEVEVCYESNGDMKHRSEDFMSATGGQDNSAHVRKEVDK